MLIQVRNVDISAYFEFPIRELTYATQEQKYAWYMVEEIPKMLRQNMDSDVRIFLEKSLDYYKGFFKSHEVVHDIFLGTEQKGIKIVGVKDGWDIYFPYVRQAISFLLWLSPEQIVYASNHEIAVPRETSRIVATVLEEYLTLENDDHVVAYDVYCLKKTNNRTTLIYKSPNGDYLENYTKLVDPF